jgi:hypothetical protein
VVTVPTADRRAVIARSAFLSDDVGQMVARHDAEGPTIDVDLAPADSGQRVHLALTPTEARLIAGQLTDLAATAQRAGWTPEILADVRERYLPGRTDQQIIERLDALTDRLGGLVLGYKGRIDWKAGRILTAEIGTELLNRAATALDAAEQHLAAHQQAVEHLGAVKAELEALQRFYRTESEPAR